MSIINNISKRFKPRAPKSVEQAMSEGATIVPRFTSNEIDANGMPIDGDRAARERAATVLVLIKEAKATIAKAEGLPPIEHLQKVQAKAKFILDNAADVWANERRKTIDPKHPPLVNAADAWTLARNQFLEADERVQRAELAEKAKAELPALFAERDA